jgi:hypothetical protein
MPDNYYPSVDLAFILSQVSQSGTLADEGIVRLSSTTTFVIEGPQPIYKRSIRVRELQPGQVCLEQATNIAMRFSFLGHLLAWLEQNRNWKEGAYIVPSEVEERT